MADTHQNYIAGDWVAGTGVIENRNPSDITDLIGHYAQASTVQVDQALDAARRAQASLHRVRVGSAAFVAPMGLFYPEKLFAPLDWAAAERKRCAVAPPGAR